MVPRVPLALTASCLLLPGVLADIYAKDSPVLQVSGSTYDNLIAKSNHTSIIEFYAPWCGHCKNLAPAYEKAAKSLSGLAKVASVNCDEESNKPFCGSMGVQGFPTLKIVKPGKKAGKPIVEDYQGARSAKAIVDAVIEKIPNHVKRLKDADYQAWLEDGDGAKAILFSDKGTTSALLKAIAVDFLGSIDVAQIRDKETQAVEVFQVEKFPTLVLVPGGGKDPVTYDGEMKKDGIVTFLSQAAAPNPDPAPKKTKKSTSSAKSADKSKASSDSSSFSKASAEQASSQAQTDAASPTPDAKPEMQEIPTLPDGLSLQQKCLNSKAGTCILALLPEASATTESTFKAIFSLSEIAHKHAQASRNLFPFYQLPTSNSQAEALRKKLSLSSDSIEIIALNGKRSWYRHYPKTSFSGAEVEDWIDAIRMGDGKKETVPDGLILDAADVPAAPIEFDTSDPVKLQEQLKEMGVEFEMEEIDDEAYERIMKQSEKAAEEEHDEL